MARFTDATDWADYEEKEVLGYPEHLTLARVIPSAARNLSSNAGCDL